MVEARAEADSALLCLARMLVFLDRPADPEQLRHAGGKGSAPLDANDVVRLAKSMGVKAKKAVAAGVKLERIPLPAIARMADEQYIVLMKVAGGKVLAFRSELERPPRLTAKNLIARLPAR